jgi:hypothetical protein
VPDSPFHRTEWIKASEVKPGDRVLTVRAFHEVTHTGPAASGSWMLRFEHGVRYDNPDAPVAVQRG